jgi:hypothetical protein
MLRSPSIDLTSYSHVNMGEVPMISSCFYRSNHVKSPSSSFCQFNVLLQYPCPGCHSVTHVLLKHRSAATRQSMLISLGRKLGPVSPWFHHWCIFVRLTIENATSYDLGVHFQEKNKWVYGELEFYGAGIPSLWGLKSRGYFPINNCTCIRRHTLVESISLTHLD